jgi:peptide-methionine (R)-S-oxide reductase
MMGRRKFILSGGVALAAAALAPVVRSSRIEAAAVTGSFAIQKSEAEWRRLLSPAAFDVLRRQGTEQPGSSPLLNEHRKGTFACAACDLSAFLSDTKFESGTGWPSFWAPIKGAVGQSDDKSAFMDRTEVHCSRCGGHLGHVFDDGPKPTGLRYCMNGVALKFHAAA